MVLAGTKAAEGVSATDMAKRLQLEQYKTQMLRKLNMYVSRVRLIVHNLPASWDDSKLRVLFRNHVGRNAIMKECRVMRNLRDVDSQGVGKSKEYGFVTFARHEDALGALRSLNNNPNIFSAHKRPVVAFSIENTVIMKAKEKRMLSSRLKNPKCKEFDPNLSKNENKVWKQKNQDRKQSEKPVWKQKNEGQKFNKKPVWKQDKQNQKPSEKPVDKFTGVAATPGIKKMRSRYNLKTQAKLHHENMKKEKKMLKYGKKTLQQKKQDFIRQPAQKVNKKGKKMREDDSFAKLVNSYKQKLISASESKKNKWYEQ